MVHQRVSFILLLFLKCRNSRTLISCVPDNNKSYLRKASGGDRQLLAAALLSVRHQSAHHSDLLKLCAFNKITIYYIWEIENRMVFVKSFSLKNLQKYNGKNLPNMKQLTCMRGKLIISWSNKNLLKYFE